jgi:hypothetical protein
VLIIFVSPVNQDNTPMKCVGSACNPSTGFVTEAKDFMEMNVTAKQTEALEDATCSTGTCHNCDACFTGENCLEHCLFN